MGEMESEREHLGLNMGMVILHKESRWGKTKRRFKSWFRREKQVKQQTTALPKIVVTSPEENLDLVKNSENGQNVSKIATERLSGNSEEVGLSEVIEVRYRRTEKDEVARAHQDVIREMRRSLAEAREGHSEGTAPYTEKVNDNVKSQKVVYGGSSQKPPVPPTKAIAVAKIG